MKYRDIRNTRNTLENKSYQWRYQLETEYIPAMASNQTAAVAPSTEASVSTWLGSQTTHGTARNSVQRYTNTWEHLGGTRLYTGA